MMKKTSCIYVVFIVCLFATDTFDQTKIAEKIEAYITPYVQ